jgi:hypothetical protein
MNKNNLANVLAVTAMATQGLPKSLTNVLYHPELALDELIEKEKPSSYYKHAGSRPKKRWGKK